MTLPHKRFEAFPSLLAVRAAVQTHSRVHGSKIYGEILA